MTDTEPRYTLDEARQALAEQECRDHTGHGPGGGVIHDGTGRAIRAVCACGLVTWLPTAGTGQ